MVTDRSSPSPLDRTESDCNSIKIFFGIFNSLFWIIAIGILGLAAWQISGSFTEGTAKVTYSLLAISIVAFIMCIVGFLTSLSNSCEMAAAYVVMFVFLIATEIGLIIACYALYPTEESVVQLVWEETNPFLIEQTESQLNCCGLNYWNDTYDSTSTVPVSCRDADGAVYQNGCSDAIITYFKSPSVYPYFLTVLITSGLIQVLAFVGGSVLFHKLRTQRKSANLPAASPTRNVVAPIIISPIPEHQPAAKSATSGWDISVSVDSANGRRSQGNEALFKVADAMLKD